MSSTGAIYTINATFNFNTVVDPGEITTQVQHLNVIGRGDIPDQRFSLFVHTTVNANGELTAARYEIKMNCSQ